MISWQDTCVWAHILYIQMLCYSKQFQSIQSQQAHKEHYMICLSGFSPDATHFLNGIRVEQTGCLDRWFHLPHRTIKKVVDTLAHWKRRGVGKSWVRNIYQEHGRGARPPPNLPIELGRWYLPTRRRIQKPWDHYAVENSRNCGSSRAFCCLHQACASADGRLRKFVIDWKSGAFYDKKKKTPRPWFITWYSIFFLLLAVPRL